MSEIEKVLDLYILELICSSTEELNSDYNRPNCYHAQCMCKACKNWDPDMGNLFEKYITRNKPFVDDTFIMNDIHRVKVNLISSPWQPCPCDICKDIEKYYIFCIYPKDGKLYYHHMKEIREKILSRTSPSLFIDGQISKDFEIGGRNGTDMEVYIDKKEGSRGYYNTMNIDIITQSTDSSVLSDDSSHIQFTLEEYKERCLEKDKDYFYKYYGNLYGIKDRFPESKYIIIR